MPQKPPEILFSDGHVEVTLDVARGLVRYKRSAEPFPSVAEVRALHGKLARSIASLPDGLVLLFDVRDAPPRNDPTFENEITRSISEFLQRFRAHAFLTKSAVGRLQVRRLASSRGDSPGSVFQSEEEALEYLGVSQK